MAYNRIKTKTKIRIKYLFVVPKIMKIQLSQIMNLGESTVAGFQKSSQKVRKYLEERKF